MSARTSPRRTTRGGTSSHRGRASRCKCHCRSPSSCSSCLRFPCRADKNRRMPKLDPSSEEFRLAGHRLIDWVADYLDGVDQHRVLANVQPGDIAKQFAEMPAGG